MCEEITISQRQKKKKPEEPFTDKRLPKAANKYAKMQDAISQIDSEIDSLNLDGMGGPEAVFKEQYQQMLDYNSRLIKRMNNQLRENLTSRDIYALSTLMSQQREVIADLRTLVDMRSQAEMVQSQVLVPFSSDITQLITDIYYQLRKLITETSAPKHTQFSLRQLEDLVKQFGMGLQAGHNASKEKLFTILLGEQDHAPVKKKRR